MKGIHQSSQRTESPDLAKNCSFQRNWPVEPALLGYLGQSPQMIRVQNGR
jgi:hypothetical protein